jgi:hypothetical protein
VHPLIGGGRGRFTECALTTDSDHQEPLPL